MKNILPIMFFLTCSCNVGLFGQITKFEDMPQEILEQMDKMGVDNLPLLNCCESAYFNVIFEKSRKGFDFRDKKIGFITGSNGKTICSKKEYFDIERNRFNCNSTPNNGTLYVFNTAQKAESGGYDAVIIYWCKVLVPIETAVKSLKEKR
jgi:hypothetical protein